MQRFDWSSTSLDTTLEHPRSSRPPSTAVLCTVTTIGALVAAAIDDRIEIEPPARPPQLMSVEFEESEREHLHSGPFNIEGCEYPIYFLDDGFTLKAGDHRLRMQRVRAYYSNLSLERVCEILGTDGVSKVVCDETLVMHSGARSLQIPATELLRIIDAANNTEGTDVSIDAIPYKLQIENGLETCLIPRYGNCTIEFRKLPVKTGAMLASGNR